MKKKIHKTTKMKTQIIAVQIKTHRMAIKILVTRKYIMFSEKT